MNLFPLLTSILLANLRATHGDSVAECPMWAEQGECTQNPSYMTEHCADACRMQAERDRDMALEIGEIVVST
eukprot:scaffold139957_cov40-Cyclotella_meneghiniana.AAC.1